MFNKITYLLTYVIHAPSSLGLTQLGLSLGLKPFGLSLVMSGLVNIPDENDAHAC